MHVGCGLNAVDGWVNIDRSPNVMLDRLPFAKKSLRRMGVLSDPHMAPWPKGIRRHDITKPLPFDDNTMEAVYSSHTLEHIYFEQVPKVLDEFQRVMVPGGIVRLALPDSLLYAQWLVERPSDPLVARRYNELLCAHPQQAPSLRRRAISRFASGPHRWQPTAALMIDLLQAAGFVEVEEYRYRVGALPDLDVIEDHEDETFYVEGRSA